MSKKKIFIATFVIFCTVVSLQNITRSEAGYEHVHVMTNSAGEEFWIGGGVVRKNHSIPYKNFDLRVLVYNHDTGSFKYWFDLILYNNNGVWKHIINGSDFGIVQSGSDEYKILMFCLNNYG